MHFRLDTKWSVTQDGKRVSFFRAETGPDTGAAATLRIQCHSDLYLLSLRETKIEIVTIESLIVENYASDEEEPPKFTWAQDYDA